MSLFHQHNSRPCGCPSGRPCGSCTPPGGCNDSGRRSPEFCDDTRPDSCRPEPCSRPDSRCQPEPRCQPESCCRPESCRFPSDGCQTFCCPPSFPIPCPPPLGGQTVCAFLCQSGALEIKRRSDHFPFCGEALLTGGFRREGGRLIIPCPGIFFACYTLHLPPGRPINTVVSLQLDGRNLPGTVLRLCRPARECLLSVCAQTIFPAETGCRLRLATCRPLCLECAGPSDTVATLSVIKL